MNPLNRYLQPMQQQVQRVQGQGSPQISDEVAESFKRTVSKLNMSGNASKALSKFASANPQFRVVMDLCGGKDPKQVFFQECQNRGIDPMQAAKKMGLL